MANYPAIAGQSVSDITTLSADNQVKAWIKNIMVGSRDHCPLYDNFIGGKGSGKPVIEIADMNVKCGKLLTIPTYARGGSQGVQGNGTRTGAGQKIIPGQFQAQTGRWWNGYNIDNVAQNETILGGSWDSLVNAALAMDLGEKKDWDIQFELRRRAVARNTLRPNNKASREALRSADIMLVDTVTDAAQVLSLNGGMGMNIRKSSEGAPYTCTTIFGPHVGLNAMKKTTKYLDAIQLAGERGAPNHAFKGGFAMLDGNGIYSWEVKDHERAAPIGSIILPRAVLGTAIAAGTTAIDIIGGGTAANAALTNVGYFQAFSGAPYTPVNGDSLAAVTDTDRYVLIYNVTGADAGKFGFYKYRDNTGIKLTMRNQSGDSAGAGGRLAAATSGVASTQVGNVTWDTGVWSGKHTDAHPIGSLIYECNSYGQPFCFGFALGEEALICGHADVDGSRCIAKKTEETQNHGMQIERGIETAWGCAVVKRAGDDLPKNYVLIEMAYNPVNLPTIV